jgi:hypothetical protein
MRNPIGHNRFFAAPRASPPGPARTERKINETIALITSRPSRALNCSAATPIGVVLYGSRSITCPSSRCRSFIFSSVLTTKWNFPRARGRASISGRLPERSPGGSRKYSYAMSMGAGGFRRHGKIPAGPAPARLDSFA